MHRFPITTIYSLLTCSFQARRHLKKKNTNGDSVKVIQPEDEMSSLVANDIVKYGGVVYETETSTIENDFIAYARRQVVSNTCLTLASWIC